MMLRIHPFVSVIALLIVLFLHSSYQYPTLSAEPLSSTSSTPLWPQWRGPDGAGLSDQTNLPVRWDSSGDNIRWKTRIPGEGHSSPVVTGDRVFLTTAYESPVLAGTRRVISGIILAIAALVILCASLSLFRPQRSGVQQAQPTVQRRVLRATDQLIRFGSAVTFLFAAILTALGPEHLNLFLAKGFFLASKYAGISFEWMTGLTRWTPGSVAAIWLISGGIALLGLAVMAGLFETRSWGRLVGVLAVFLVAGALCYWAPLDQYERPLTLAPRLLFLTPALAVSCWHMVSWLEARFRGAPPISGQSGPRRLLKLWPVAISALIFVPENLASSQLRLHRVVLCLDLNDGNILWERPVFSVGAERKYRENTYATPTPCTDGKHVVAHFGVGLACLDMDGEVLWRHEDPGYAEDSRYGAVSSPIMHGDMVIVVQEREFSGRPTWIAAFDKQTGEKRWEIQPEYARSSYSTPLLFTTEGGTQLLTSTVSLAVAYDVDSGDELWRHRTPMTQQVASMVRSGNILCAAGGTHGVYGTLVMRLDQRGQNTAAEALWETTDGTPGVSSPIIVDGKLFVVTDHGLMTCFELLTGKVHWTAQLKRGRRRWEGKYFASLVAGDGKVYACNTEGATTVLAADSNLQILAENELNEKCCASPAFAGRRLLIRTVHHLFCIEENVR